MAAGGGRIPAGTRRFLARCAVFGVVGAVLLAPVAAAVDSAAEAGAQALTESLPVDSLVAELPQRSTVLAADGSVLATFFRQDRLDVRLDEIAPVLRAAVIATEDARFYSHGAVDPVGVLRALAANFAAGEVAEGGSTLTQQYVKQALLLQADNAEEAAAATETSVDRKLREVGYAIGVEAESSKDEILARYLNIAYFGNGAYGAEVAARRYFGVSASELTLPQAALLAGLVKAPTAFDPVRHPAAARERRGVVLNRMVAAKSIDPGAAERARRAPLDLQLTPARNGCAAATYPWFCGYVQAELQSLPALGATPGERLARVLDGGLTIRTTLDPTTQRAAVQAVRSQIDDDHPVGTAIVLTEPGTGAVRAIWQNRRFGEGEGETTVNFALDAAQGGSGGFQGGSTFKPFVLAAALKQGISPDLYLSAPGRTVVSGFEGCGTRDDFPPYEVGNYDRRGYRALDMAAATAMSVNTYFVRLAQRTGVCAPPRLAEAMGLARADGEALSRVPSFVLGVDEVSPLRLAEAYATLAAGGMHCASHAVTAITTADGEEFEVPGERCERALPASVAKDVTELLRGVIDGDNPNRTGARMTLGRPAAGKTGTTNNAVAVWFAGYTKALAAAVWAGYPEASRPLRDVRIGGQTYERLFGGALPGPIWQAAMKRALR